jgi:hypothetical protein
VSTKPGPAIIGAAGLKCGRVEGVDLQPGLREERCMLLDAVWVKAVNPENWVIDTVNGIGPIVLAGSCMNLRIPNKLTFQGGLNEMPGA